MSERSAQCGSWNHKDNQKIQASFAVHCCNPEDRTIHEPGIKLCFSFGDWYLVIMEINDNLPLWTGLKSVDLN
jgi:hypothetical protein